MGAAARRTVEVLAFACLPLLLLGVFTVAPPAGTAFWDFHAFWGAAANIDHGRSPYAALGANTAGTPYPGYVYPPLLAELLTPLGALPFAFAAALFAAASVAAIVVALRLLGVRDWRCYGVAFLWVPVLHGLRLGALTPFLVLALAAGRRPLATSLKLFLWPLLIVGRPLRGVATATLIALGSWALVGFAGLTAYPSLLRAAQSEWERNGYGLAAVAVHLGVAPGTASTALLAAGAAALPLLGRLEPRAATAGAITLAVLVSPVAWLHYAALLLVPVALYQPRLGWAWVLPLLLWLTPYEEARGNMWRVGLWLAVMIATPAVARLARCTARTHRASTPASWRSSGRSYSPSSSTSG